MSALLLILAFGGLVAVFVWFVSRARVVVALCHGTAQVVRGDLPGGVFAEIRDVARHAPRAAGRVEIRGRRGTLGIAFTGLDEGTAQRLRNVLLLHRDRL